MNFERDIQEYLKGEFDFFGIPYTKSPDVDGDLLQLFTIQRKYIYPVSRIVEVSKELQQKIDSSSKYSGEIMAIKKDFEEGRNVNLRQSKNLYNIHVHDDLVYDWNIYHLHLSSEPHEILPNFSKRTKEVLFAYVKRDKVLLLDIFAHPPHDVFANKILLEILDNHWADELLFVKDIIGLSHNATSKERLKLRKHNINEGILEINGKFVGAPGLGQVSSGHSGAEVMKLNDFRNWIDSNEQMILEGGDGMDALMMGYFNLANKPSYSIVFTDEGPQIHDSLTQTCLIRYREIINSPSSAKKKDN